MKDLDNEEKQLKQAKGKDSTDGGRNRAFMTVDAWNQDGNPAAAADEFGPELKQEAPPTLNGKPL